MSAIHQAREAVVTAATTARTRRRIYAGLALVLAILCLFPTPYLSRARIMPQDTNNAAGITGLMTLIGGQSQNVATLLAGGRPSNDLYLIIGRSDSVQQRVVDALKMVGPDGYSSAAEAKRALERKVDVNLLLGGVMEIQSKTWSPKESQILTAAYVEAVSKELASFGEQLIVNKRRIIDRRFSTAKDRVAETEIALNEFRQANNLAAPEAQLGNELSLRTALQAQLQAKQVELQTLQQFSGPENPTLRAVQTEIAALREKISRTAAPSTDSAGPNLAGSSQLTTRYLNLYRDYRLAQAMYEVYVRSNEQLALDQMAAETASYVQVIDPAYLDVDRQYNIWAVALLGFVLLMVVFTEVYAPMTGLFNLDAPRKPDGHEP
ncbi:MAG: capsule biosynthesis protein [Novosphingobium sp.]